MVFCEIEDLDVDVKTDTDIEIYSLGDDNGHFPGQIIKDEGVKNEHFDSDLRKINDTQPTVTQPQAKDSVIKRSNMPQIIQVTSVEKSKTKYSYQYSENYYDQLERPGSRMNNKPANGATHFYQDDIKPYHGTRRGGLIQVVPKENTSSYSYKAPNPPTEALGGKPPITVTRTKEVKDNFTDLVIKEFVNGQLDGEADEDDEAVYNRLTTPERDRKNRPKSSYSIRNTGRRNVHLPPLQTNEDSHFTSNYAGKVKDTTNHDVTLSITSTKASKALDLEVIPPIISYNKFVSDKSNILTGGSVPKLESGENIPRDSVILGSKMKSTNFLRRMGLRPLPQWSRHLPP